jgi:ribosomal protein L40E
LYSMLNVFETLAVANRRLTVRRGAAVAILPLYSRRASTESTALPILLKRNQPNRSSIMIFSLSICHTDSGRASMFCTECGSINPECGKFCHRCGELLFRPKADETAQFAEPSICKWQHALDEYRYPVNLTTFADRQEYSGWFTRNIEIGDRAQTIKFETLFRQNAPEHLEAWFEVVFWKLYKVAVPALSSYRAKIVIDSVRRRGVSAGELWSRCSEFTECPSIAKFEAFCLVERPVLHYVRRFRRLWPQRHFLW